MTSISVEETLTNNVNLHESNARRSDFITEVTPRLSMSNGSAYASGDVSLSLPMYFYARTGSENNRVVPQVTANGHAELYKEHLFVDASANVSQEYFSPFGARSESLATRTNNEYTAENYRVSPYFRGTTPGELSYEVRDNNVWTKLSNTPVATSDSYLNELLADVTRPTVPLGWALDYKRSDLKFHGAESQTTMISHARLIYRPDPQLEISGSGGYEEADFPATSYNNVTYGVGFRWRPTERTNVDANWEHRFFGSAYLFNFQHRTPLTSWSLYASRDISSYPQLLAQLQAGGITASLLDSLFRSRIPDPAAREQFVQQFIEDRSLPDVLTGPVSVYNQLVTIHERVTATAGIIGARNSVFFTAYHSRLEPLAGNLGSPLPLAQAQNDNTQNGVGVHWSYNIAASWSLSTTANYAHTTSNGQTIGTTDFTSLRTLLSSAISRNTSVHAGARYQQSHSTISEDFNEFAIFAGFTHVFR